jgi:diguanylate cyclase (GGDEF)-like protein
LGEWAVLPGVDHRHMKFYGSARLRSWWDVLGEGQASRLTLGRVGGVLFIGAGVVVALTTPVADGAAMVALEVAAAASIMAGVVALMLPWDEWPAVALLSQTAVGLALIAVAGRGSGALDHYLPMFVVTFVFVGLTQPARTLFWMLPAVVLTFLVGAGGSADGRTYVNFAVTLVVALIVGLILSSFVSRSAAGAERIEQLLVVSRALIRSRTMIETTTLLESSTNAILAADLVFTFLAEPDRPTRLVTVLPTPPGLPPRLTLDLAAERSGTAGVLELDEPLFAPHAPTDGRLSHRLVDLLDCESLLLVPLTSGSTRLGVLAFCWRTRVAGLSPWSTRAVSLLAVEAGIMLERQRAAERVANDALTDPLTGLLNRRAIERRMTLLTAGDSLVLLDVDRFKHINDTYGHAEGDDVLQSLASCLTATVRHDDWCGRLGGDEFLLVLRGGGHGGTRGVLAELHQAWQAVHPSVTFSAGAAVVRAGEDSRQVLARADEALYLAKEAGRNRTEIALGA